MILDLKALKEGMTFSGQLVYVQTFTKKAIADGTRNFVFGTVMNKGVEMPFKIWESDLVTLFSQHDFTGHVIKVSGSVVEYKEKLELKIANVSYSKEEDNPSQFFKSVNVDVVFDTFATFVNENLTEKAIALLMGIFKSENLFDRFKQEFAGARMHDAQVGGTMNHTTKMLFLAKALVTNDPRLLEAKDLLYLGVIFHDIGKLQEMQMGVYTEYSFVTHRAFGIELLVKYKQQICQTFNENFYYHLVAIIQGHHGKWGEPPKTIWAYIVHLIDNLESATTGIFDRIESESVTTKSTQRTLKVDDMHLTY